MPEQKMSYQERLEATAKRHADRYNAGGRREYAGGPLLRNDPEHMMDEAQETIAMQAEAIRQYEMQFGNALVGIVEPYLLEHGYKPKTEEDDSTRTH